MSIKKVNSKQNRVQFSFCPHPFTIDKSSEWGEGNKQLFPDGGYMKHESIGSINVTHGVQPNIYGTSPIGWLKNNDGTFRKQPIFIGEELKVGTTHELNTLDGVVSYEVKEPSILCYNGTTEPNMKDVYVQSIKNLQENYFVD